MAYDIRLAKLVTGETIIAKFDAPTDSFKDVATIQTIPSQQGVQMMLLPFGYPFEQDFTGTISKQHVIYEYKNCPEELQNKYLEATSNLSLSSAGLGGLNLSGDPSKISPLLKK